MPRNTSAISILPLLLVLLLGIGAHTNASKLSMPILHRNGLSPSRPKHSNRPEEPPTSTGIPIKDHLQEKLATMSYQLEWVCQPNNPSQPKCHANKYSWPELVGKKGKEAKAVIQREDPIVDAVVYAPQDGIVADKYCCNRVRLIMDCDAGCDYENATVFQVPIVG